MGSGVISLLGRCTVEVVVELSSTAEEVTKLLWLPLPLPPRPLPLLPLRGHLTL